MGNGFGLIDQDWWMISDIHKTLQAVAVVHKTLQAVAVVHKTLQAVPDRKSVV